MERTYIYIADNGGNFRIHQNNFQQESPNCNPITLKSLKKINSEKSYRDQNFEINRSIFLDLVITTHFISN